ncbi:unnamed protein product [Caenorhabditis brenneri]
MNLQRISKEDQKKELKDVVAGPAEQSPEATWFSWIRTVPVLFYLNCFLFVSIQTSLNLHGLGLLTKSDQTTARKAIRDEIKSMCL